MAADPLSTTPAAAINDHGDPAPLAHHRRVIAYTVGIIAVLCYNWWIVVPFVPGMMPSLNGFFSDLEVIGRPHAALLLDADLVAGLLMLAALVIRGPRGPHGPRREWWWMLVFAAAGIVGSREPYACSEGISAVCRHREWTGQLPMHHYTHMIAGIVEFGAITTAAVLASHRTHRETTHSGPDPTPTLAGRLYRVTMWILALGYPFLGFVYLTDRLGTFVEPIFFVAFSIMFLTVLFEPDHYRHTTEPPPSTPPPPV